MRIQAGLFSSILLLAAIPGSQYCVAQDLKTTATVPRLVKFSGVLKDIQGRPKSGPIALTFSVYSDEERGDALWSETQTLNASADGRYEVLLGGETSGGLPPDLFGESSTSTNGIAQAQGRWLGIQVAGEPEQRPRVMLVSVPYALKAADAEKLGGKAASDFVLADQLRTPEGLAQLGIAAPLTPPGTDSRRASRSNSKTGQTTIATPAAFGTGNNNPGSLGALSGTTGQFTYTFFDANTDLPVWLDVSSIYVNRSAAFHITGIYCEINAGSASINLQKNGQNILAASLPCSTNGAQSSNFVSGLNAVAVGDKISHVMVSVGPGLRRMNVVVTYSWD